MDPVDTVIDAGVVYARNGEIVAALPVGEPPPDGFADVVPVVTDGTVFPGLIELHNHLPYDVLPLWAVPKRFTNRGQWSGRSDYHRLVTAPMSALGGDPDVVPAIVRYVEVKCLLGGTTTSQGLTLAVDPGIASAFRGLVRNVEAGGSPDLPSAVTHIADVEATDSARFLARLSGNQKLLLHLAEGVDEAARAHFLALQIDAGKWAITPNLIGIHCAGLTAADFSVFAAHGGSMVWSPLSNLLLYGSTARIGDARSAGVPVALGSDWAPSGSTNVLNELKIAQLAAPLAGADLSARDLVAMVTRTPARMLGWDAHLGGLERGKRADLIVVQGVTSPDPYQDLVSATESDIELVVIDGVPRAGTASLMGALGAGGGELVDVGGHSHVLNLEQADADPRVQALTVAEATRRLDAALADLPTTTDRATRPGRRTNGRALLAVDGVIDNRMSPRPHLPYRGRFTGPDLPTGWAPSATAAGTLPASPRLGLDPLCVVDNPGYFASLAHEANLPTTLRNELAARAPAGTSPA